MVKLLTPPWGNVSQANIPPQAPLLVPIVLVGLMLRLMEVRRVPSADTRPAGDRLRAALLWEMVA